MECPVQYVGRHAWRCALVQVLKKLFHEERVVCRAIGRFTDIKDLEHPLLSNRGMIIGAIHGDNQLLGAYQSSP